MLNEESELFHSRTKCVNYESPYQAISLPVFTIHGNHDDPTREGGHESLSAMDLLSTCGLVNYFGKSNEVDNIEITPILLRKQDTTIAIYGLGAVRDERLNRMWNQKKVKFVRPTEDQGQESFFNIFILHQNRDYGRGSKNCIHESMIPEWIDVVIWGNEHLCIPSLNESLVGTFRIYQPGSSVATSLVDGESLSNPKHMGLLEIRGRQFRLHTTRYTHNRPFIYDEINLSAVRELDAKDPKVEEKIQKVLSAKITAMIQEAKVAASNAVTDLPPISTPPLYGVRSPEQVLVRLRVEHAGFPTLNQNRFGAAFVGKVANPSDLLLFAKKKKDFSSRGVEGAGDRDRNTLLEEGAEEDGIDKIKIDDLVRDSLRNSRKPLSLLVENDLTLVNNLRLRAGMANCALL